jgi:hypothetical protein
MSRGIVYLTWRGDFDVTNVLQRSLASIRYWHPELPHEVIEMPEGSNLYCKSEMFDRSPFDETLFLDADTTVMGKLDYGFQQAKKHGIACCVNANPWQRRYYKLPWDHPDTVEYSSGVVFFDKSHPQAGGVFDRWRYLTARPDINTASRFVGPHGLREMPLNDQALFSRAIQEENFNPFILPLNWNIYPRWQKHFWGEIKVWHGYDDIPQEVVNWNAGQRKEDAIIQCGGLP